MVNTALTTTIGTATTTMSIMPPLPIPPLSAWSSLPPSHYSALRDIFKQKDVNGTGTLSSSELEDCLGVCGLRPTKEELSFLKKHFDSNGNDKNTSRYRNLAIVIS